MVSWPIWNALGLAASVVLALGVGYAWGIARARSNLLVDEAVTDHIRSLQFNHLSDVASTDQHTVKPWFDGKLDFSPPVMDLAAAGYPLTGGRLEHLAGRPAAALVFHRRAHPINLFIWPASVGTVSTRQGGLSGYHTQSWSQKGFNFLAVSEISAAELSQFAAAFQAANPG
jgi:anti-sigma factor RsiW